MLIGLVKFERWEGRNSWEIISPDDWNRKGWLADAWGFYVQGGGWSVGIWSEQSESSVHGQCAETWKRISKFNTKYFWLIGLIFWCSHAPD